jgi:hypothetical protein
MLQNFIGFYDIGIGVIACNICNTTYSRCCASESCAENQSHSQSASRCVAECDSTNQSNAQQNLSYALSICR